MLDEEFLPGSLVSVAIANEDTRAARLRRFASILGRAYLDEVARRKMQAAAR